MNQREKEKSQARRTSAKSWAEDTGKSFESKAFKIPKGLEMFKVKKECTKKLDFIPFIAGEGNPRADEGMEHFERTYYSHKGIGSGNDIYLCPLKSLDKPCPVCEYLAKHRGDQDLYRELGPKMRHLWLIIDTESDDKELMLWETAFWKGFGEKLKKEIDSDPEAYENFFSLTEGLSVRIRFTEESYQGHTYFSPDKVDFVPRKNQYEKSKIKESPCLDECLLEISYKDLKRKFEESGDSSKEDGGSEEVDEQANGKAKSHKEESDELTNEAQEAGLEKGMTVTYDDEKYEIIKISGDGSSLTLENDDGDTVTGIAPGEVEKVKAKAKKEEEEEEEEIEEDEKPSKKSPKAKDDDEEEPEESDDDDWDDEDIDSDDDSEDGDDDSDDDSEEEDELPKKKKTVKKTTKVKKKTKR